MLLWTVSQNRWGRTLLMRTGREKDHLVLTGGWLRSRLPQCWHDIGSGVCQLTGGAWQRHRRGGCHWRCHWFQNQESQNQVSPFAVAYVVGWRIGSRFLSHVRHACGIDWLFARCSISVPGKSQLVENQRRDGSLSCVRSCGRWGDQRAAPSLLLWSADGEAKIRVEKLNENFSLRTSGTRVESLP